MKRLIWTMCMVLAVGACGGDTGDGAGTEKGSAGGEVQRADQDSSGGSGDAPSTEGDDGAANSGSEATATLVVGDETHVFEGNQWTYCTIGGVFPVSVEFQREEVKWDDDWFQFIDRGDGGINFSAVIDGEEYQGTGSGEADEIRSDGFTYGGTMNRGGEVLDTVLEVSC